MSHLLEVTDLTTVFTGDYGKNISVDHVSFHIDPGEVVCIVGESGCGKSVTSLSIMGLLGKGGAVIDGSVLFDDKNLLAMTEKEFDQIRGNQISMIFQDPLTALDPAMPVGRQIAEAVRTHRGRMERSTVDSRVAELLALKGVEPEGGEVYRSVS